MTMTVSPGFRHQALLVDADRTWTDVVTPLLRSGLMAGDALLLACTPRATDLLPDSVLAHPAARVIDPGGLYQRPGAAVSVIHEFLEEMLHAGFHRVGLVGEVSFGSDRASWDAWATYEATINVIFVSYPAWHVCVYDTRILPAAALRIAAETHPELRTGDAAVPNAGYVEPVQYLRRKRELRPPEPTQRPVLDLAHVEHPTALGAVRQTFATAIATAAPATVVEDFTLAVNEIITNALRHGRTPVRLRLWTTAQRSVCLISDAGPGIDDPLAGYHPPSSDAPATGGMGLWLVRQLCDSVHLSTTSEGFTVRLEIAH